MTKRVAAHIDVAISAELCIRAIQAALGDARLREAYRALRPGKEYTGWVTALVPGRHVELTFAALEPSTRRRTHALGWRVTYDFAPTDGGRTRVEVGIEYGLLASLAAAGTLRAQAENDIAHRLAGLHALEVGVYGGAVP